MDPTSLSRERAALQGISRTLLIPLYARAHAPELLPASGFDDASAAVVASSLGISRDDVGGDVFPMRLCVARSLAIEQALLGLLTECPDRTAVLLACGLDTLPQRLDAPSVKWLCGDLPEVLAVRDRLLPPNARIRHADIELPDRLDDLLCLLPLPSAVQRPIFVLEGILPYLASEHVFRCFSRLIDACPFGADLVFDNYHPALLAFSRLGATFRHMRVTFRFGLRAPEDYVGFSHRLRFIVHQDFLQTLPWTHRKRALLPGLVAGPSALASVVHLEILSQ